MNNVNEYRIVFDSPSGPDGCRLIEVENEHGQSINAGEWHQRDDGLWELRIPTADATLMNDAVKALRDLLAAPDLDFSRESRDDKTNLAMDNAESLLAKLDAGGGAS